MIDTLDYERNKVFFQTDAKEEGAKADWISKKTLCSTERYFNSKITYFKNMYEHKKFVFVLEFDEEDDDKEHS